MDSIFIYIIIYIHMENAPTTSSFGDDSGNEKSHGVLQITHLGNASTFMVDVQASYPSLLVGNNLRNGH